jgi:hypothetical protein
MKFMGKIMDFEENLEGYFLSQRKTSFGTVPDLPTASA